MYWIIYYKDTSTGDRDKVEYLRDEEDMSLLDILADYKERGYKHEYIYKIERRW